MEGHSLEERSELRADPRLIFSIIVGGYAGLVFLAFWVDGKLYKRRLRKRREHGEFKANDQSWFKKGDPHEPKSG